MGITSNVGEPSFAEITDADHLEITDSGTGKRGKVTVADLSAKIVADAGVSAAITAALTVAFASLPAEDPASAGAIWNGGGVLKISAGA